MAPVLESDSEDELPMKKKNDVADDDDDSEEEEEVRSFVRSLFCYLDLNLIYIYI
jgi:hypothetical protein